MQTTFLDTVVMQTTSLDTVAMQTALDTNRSCHGVMDKSCYTAVLGQRTLE